MPYAVSTASAPSSSTTPSRDARPSTAQSRGRRWLRRLVGAAVGLSLLVPVAAGAPEPVFAGSCTGWTSTVVPPETIRVLRLDGVVERVNFRRYVAKVMASGEWPARLPRALLRSGAQATKQFAWYHSLKGNHRSSFVTASGKCYDVVATTRDQLYKPGADVRPAQWAAVDAIWDLSLHRNGNFILTPYRAGDVKRCAADADGKRLYARSAKRCAWLGWSAERILRTYYSGDNNVALVSSSMGASFTTEAMLAAVEPQVVVPLNLTAAIPT